MEFSDFDIKIVAKKEDGFVVLMESQHGERCETIKLNHTVDELLQMLEASLGTNVETRDMVAEQTPTANTRSSARSEPRRLGKELYEFLFPPDFKVEFAECMSAATAGVRVRLTMNTKDEAVADLARLPWELMYDDSNYKYFGKRPDTLIVRYPLGPNLFEAQSFQPPFRILVVAANPKGDLALDLERNNLQAALEDDPNIELYVIEDATIQDIAARLARDRIDGKEYHALHYMGHGDFDKGKGVLLLHKKGGGASRVDADAFRTALQASGGSIRLVFLNACNTAQSAGQSGEDPFAGVATALVHEGVPAVVAMQRPIPDEAAIELAKTFYAGIAEGWPLDFALTEGRRQMFFNNDKRLDWAIPVLFMRSRDGVLFDLSDSALSGDGILPQPLRLTVPTGDRADQIGITSTPSADLAGQVRVCLEVQTKSGWWKGIGLNQHEPTLEGERRDGRTCTTISPSNIYVSYWKAKVLGVHTHVGTGILDLRPFKDHEVMFTWKED